MLRSILPRRAQKSQSRAFRPTVLSLEDRQLLALALVGQTPSFHITAPPLYPNRMISISDNLGTVSVGPNQRLTETINYGDGSPTEDGWFGANPTIQGAVNTAGQHNYQYCGSYTITISLTDASGNNLTWTDPVQVDPTVAPVKPPPEPTLTLVENTPVGTNQDVVGAPFSDTLSLISSDPLTRLVAVTWSFQTPDWKGVIDPSGTSVDASGYHVSYVTATNQASRGSNVVTLDRYCWGATPGTYRVAATASWVDASGMTHQGSKMLTDNVVAPVGKLTCSTSNVAAAKENLAGGLDEPDYIVKTSGFAKQGIVITATIDPQKNIPGLSGTYGIVQTFTSDFTSTEVTNGTSQTTRYMIQRWDGTGPVYQTPPTIVDFYPSPGNTMPYYPYAANGKLVTTPASIGATSSASINDSPQSAGRYGTSGHRLDVFTDTLMFTPTGGVPVPLGFVKWDWGYDFTFPANGGRAIGSSTPPTVFVQYTKTTTYPTWKGQMTDFIKLPEGKVKGVQLNPDGTVPRTPPVAKITMPTGTMLAASVEYLFSTRSPEERDAYLAWLDSLPDASPIDNTGNGKIA